MEATLTAERVCFSAHGQRDRYKEVAVFFYYCPIISFWAN